VVTESFMWSLTTSCGLNLPTSAGNISSSKTLCKIFGQSRELVAESFMWSATASCGQQQLHVVTNYRHHETSRVSFRSRIGLIAKRMKIVDRIRSNISGSNPLCTVSEQSHLVTESFMWSKTASCGHQQLHVVTNSFMWSPPASCGHQLQTSASNISSSKTLCKIFGQSHVVTESFMWSPIADIRKQNF
jgi:hypothetical protein